MARDLAIVLNNGSINSAVSAALAAQKYRLVMLYCEAVPNAASRLRQAYDMQVAHFKPYREHTLAIPYLHLLNERSTPAAHAAATGDARLAAPLGGQLSQLLPLVAASAVYAAHYQAAAVYLGLRVGPGTDELAQATEYMQIWSELIQQPCGHPDIEVVTPVLELEAWQTVDVGFQVNAPFERTWSCFDESSDPCWSCSRCRAREAAFQQAGKGDPLRATATAKKT
jgi:hypothetical protein